MRRTAQRSRSRSPLEDLDSITFKCTSPKSSRSNYFQFETTETDFQDHADKLYNSRCSERTQSIEKSTITGKERLNDLEFSQQCEEISNEDFE